MARAWAMEETATSDLADKRLNDRLSEILSALGDHPTASIPAACGGAAEMTAAYRFFDNEKATYESVLQPHFDATRKRIAGQQVVLFVQDTSELDLTRPRQQVTGAGPMDSTARRGAYLHALESFTPDGMPLGAVGAKMWTRDDASFALSPKEKRKNRKASPIEEKESFRWIEGLRRVREIAQELPNVLCVCVGDSESDIYSLFVEPRGERPVHWLVRACQERCVCDENGSSGKVIREEVMGGPVLFTNEITVRGRQAKIACEDRSRRVSRKTREAVVETRAAQVTLHPPKTSGSPPAPVAINAVLVLEANPPEGEEAIEWLLLTTLPVETTEEVRQVVQYYAVRWMIEIFFRTLKSGCRVEERHFEHLDRLLPCVAIYLIVAWRTLMLVRLGRSCPDLDCEAVFEPAEWKSVWMVIHQEPPPDRPPALNIMLRLIAQLGGYVNRPNRPDPPGPQTTWLGLQRMRDLAWAWQTFGPGATGKTPTLV